MKKKTTRGDYRGEMRPINFLCLKGHVEEALSARKDGETKSDVYRSIFALGLAARRMGLDTSALR